MAGPWEKYSQPKSSESESGSGPWAKYEQKTSEPSEINSLGRGLAQGASLGFADEITGGAEALLNKVQGSDESLSDLYAKRRDESRAAYDRAKEANPKSFLTGEIGGGVGTAFIPGLGAANAAKIGTIAGKAAIQGGIAGIGSSTADNAPEMLQDSVRGAALGGVAGAAGGALSKGVSYVAKNGVKSATDAVANKLSDFAEMRAANALGATKRALNKQGLEKMKELGRSALDEGVVTPLATTDKMISRSQALRERGGKAMGEVYDAIDNEGASTFNPLKVASKVDEKLSPEFRTPINKGEVNQLENTLESILLRGDKDIPLNKAQLLKEEIGKVAYPKGFTKDVTPKMQMARDAYSVIRESIDQSAEDGSKKIGSENLLNTLQRGKKEYGLGKSFEDLLSNRVSSEEGNKLFGLTDTITGVGAMSTMGQAGIALVGAKKAAEKFGNQVLATGSDKVAKSISRIPGKVDSFAAPIQRLVQGSSLNLNQKIRSPYSTATASNMSEKKDRDPSSLKGEDKWATKGSSKLGLSEDQTSAFMNSKAAKALLIEASDLPAGSKKLQEIKTKLQGMVK